MLATASGIEDLTNWIDKSSIRVYAPTQVIFICGGKVPEILPAQNLASLRDAFIRTWLTTRLFKYQTRLAEELLPFFPKGRYTDILDFESDIAQISELIVLFPESAGSFAELGAFAMDEEISKRLLVVTTQHFYAEDSFIRLGPIQALENKHTRAAICVLDDARLHIPREGAPVDLRQDLFSESMQSAVSQRLTTAHERTSFRKDRNGHVIKLIVGLVQHYGALTDDEIEVLLFCLGVPVTRVQITDFLVCAQFMDWVKADPRGLRTYFAARPGNKAISYHLISGAPKIDDVRWRSDIRAYWESTDHDRFVSITAAAV